jgi:hypothetical protein
MKRILQLICFIALTIPVNGQAWITLTPPPVSQTFPVMVALRGNIHVVGGSIAGVPTSLHLRYSPATDTWDTLPPVPYAASQPAGALVNEKIHFCGGESSGWLDNHYYFDPDSIQWYQAANLPAGIAIHETVVLDNKLHVLTGMPNQLIFQYYDPVTDSWTLKNPLPTSCIYSAIESASGEIYKFGGGLPNFPSPNAIKYNPVTDVWNSLPTLPLARCSPASTVLDSSRIMISGGYTSIATSECWIYHIPTQIYYPSDNLAYPTSFHNMVTIDSCVYLLGAYNGVLPATNVWLTMNCNPVIYTGTAPEPQIVSLPYTIMMTSAEYTIIPENPIADSGWSVYVFDGAGREMKNIRVSSSQSQYHIDGSNLNNGIYTISIHTGNAVFTERWLVLR